MRRQLLLIIFLLYIVNTGCGNRRSINGWEPIDIPTIGNPVLSLYDEIVYSSEPDSTWLGTSGEEIHFRFRIPEDLTSSISDNVHLFILGGLNAEMANCSVEILNTTGTSVALSWDYFAGVEPNIALVCSLPQLPDLSVVMHANGDIYGISHGVNPILMEIVSGYTSTRTMLLSTGTRNFLPVINNTFTRLFVLNAQYGFAEIDNQGNLVSTWEGTAEFWTDAAFYQGEILLYQKTGYGPYGHDFPAYLKLKSPSDPGTTFIAQNDEFRIQGIEVIDEMLYAVDFDGLRSRLYVFSISELFSGAGFRQALQDSSTLDFLITGPLGCTPDGRLVGVSPYYIEGFSGRQGIVIMDTGGHAIGQWVVPFSRIKALVYDGSELIIYPIEFKNEAIGPIPGTLFSRIPSFISPNTVWFLSVEVPPN